MRRGIGITTSEHGAVGVVEGHQLVRPLRRIDEQAGSEWLLSLTPEGIAERLAQEIGAIADGEKIDAVGVGLPGIIRNGLVEESPNLKQLKGARFQELMSAALEQAGIVAAVCVHNDADVMAAGMAATRGQLDRLIRVWTLGDGIGFGIFPWRDGIWEGGHMVVSLDPREKYCACGGRGHLEGIMGHRAMRLRFMDMEPVEIFENARRNDQRCIEFVKLWHQALAAATASMIHMGGPGKFFITGVHAKHVDLSLLEQYLQEMVKMSPLQSYAFEIVPASDEIAVIGAAVNAIRAAYPD